MKLDLYDIVSELTDGFDITDKEKMDVIEFLIESLRDRKHLFQLEKTITTCAEYERAPV
jgi:hypothetical protein